jgi:hypothetical protein
MDVKAKNPEESEAEFVRLAQAVSSDPRVDPPEVARAKGFGTKGLKVARKMFAFHSKGRLVVKLPADRVHALVSEGKGDHFDPGHGHLMKEWIALGYAQRALWPKVAKEALEFAARVAPGSGVPGRSAKVRAASQLRANRKRPR